MPRVALITARNSSAVRERALAGDAHERAVLGGEIGEHELAALGFGAHDVALDCGDGQLRPNEGVRIDRRSELTGLNAVGFAEVDLGLGPTTEVVRLPVVDEAAPGSDLAVVLTRLRAEGYAISSSYDGADLVVVNTCGFIEASKKESIDKIIETKDVITALTPVMVGQDQLNQATASSSVETPAVATTTPASPPASQ